MDLLLLHLHRSSLITFLKISTPVQQSSQQKSGEKKPIKYFNQQILPHWQVYTTSNGSQGQYKLNTNSTVKLQKNVGKLQAVLSQNNEKLLRKQSNKDVVRSRLSQFILNEFADKTRWNQTQVK